MQKSEPSYYLNWAQQCSICCINQDIFLLNFCKCSVIVCQNCYLIVKEIASSRWIYRYPCCCHDKEISFKSLPSWLISKAMDNWRVCFHRQDGARRLLHKKPQIDKDNWRQIYQVLNTRAFWEKNAASVCRDIDTANSFVRDQLYRFEC